MTHLRKIMLEELQRRHYSERTRRGYIRAVEDFARRFHCPPDQLGSRQIREYQAELFQKRNLSAATVAIRLAALRFFFTKTLNRTWSIAETPYPKKAHRLPTILSQQEVAQLIDAAGSPHQRILLMKLYATGVRNAELTRLKVSDVDSQRIVIHVQGGKGRRDRDVLLSPKLLQQRRAEKLPIQFDTIVLGGINSSKAIVNRRVHGITPNPNRVFGACFLQVLPRDRSFDRKEGMKLLSKAERQPAAVICLNYGANVVGLTIRYCVILEFDWISEPQKAGEFRRQPNTPR